MSEFLQACVAGPVNLTLSVLLVLTFLYWIVAIVGGIGVDTFDVDANPDLDVDLDVDADVDTDTALAHHGGGAGSMSWVFGGLRLLGVGEVPMLVLASVWLLLSWVVAVLSAPLVRDWPLWLELLAWVPTLLATLILTGLLTTPLRVVFARMRRQEAAEQQLQIVGRRGRIVSLHADERSGQLELETAGAPLRLNVRTGTAEHVLHKGEEAVVVGEDHTTGVYLVRGF